MAVLVGALALQHTMCLQSYGLLTELDLVFCVGLSNGVFPFSAFLFTFCGTLLIPEPRPFFFFHDATRFPTTLGRGCVSGPHGVRP